MIHHILLITLCIIFLIPNISFAYLYLGTGSIILQALVAGIIGLGIFWRRIIKGIKQFFK